MQLFIVLLEVEEAKKIKATASNKEEERRLMQNTQKKVEQIYSRLQSPTFL